MARREDSELLTVAAIRKPKREGPTEYLFNERQQIFNLRETTKSAEKYSRIARTALRKKRPVWVSIDRRRPIIRRIDAPTSEETESFFKERTFVKEPDKVVKIDVDKIDPTTFNLVDYYLKFKVFLLCKRVVPSYQKAKEIFDYCAQQSCHLPGPHDVSPCIPFQYVRDGCFARAHKMRWVITTKYRYCCEKVFSFANEGNDTLAVRADKWGGCCVTWWYHVAPLIRMRTHLRKVRFPGMRSRWVTFELAMVIDPGMFDKPVLLSTWLSAQQNTACHPDANVSKYSIQPGSAYWPANYAGTAFGTDPSYTSTDSYLGLYSGMVTCP